MRKINWIVLHCTATPQSTTVESIVNYWRNSLGWKQPGYHRIIKPNGEVVELLPLDQVSNGVAGFNKDAVHTSYIGGIDGNGRAIDNRTCEQRESMRLLVEQDSEMFPDAIIQGHRDFSPDKNRDGIITANEWLKTCPSFSVKDWLSEIEFKSKAAAVYLETTANVNIREGSGTSFKTVASALPKGVPVRKIGVSGAWTYVSIEKGVKGWISSKYLKTVS